jgi:RNase P subunit RPR2
MRCPKCDSRNLTSIRIRLAPEEERVFASCHGCEWKGWFKEGSAVPLADVLSLASERRF